MGRWKKVLKTVLLFCAAAAGVLLLTQGAAVRRGDCVVRVAYRGLEHLFRPAEYYALAGARAVRIWPVLAGDIRTVFEDLDTLFWYGELEYAENGSGFSEGTGLGTGYGPAYRLTLRPWTGSTPEEPEAADREILCRAAEELHSGSPEAWIWQGGGVRGLTGFLLIRHGERRLLVQGDRLLWRAEEDGSFHLLLEVPKGGQLDGFRFRERG